ncbi:hypothetical protein DFH09DRAFT_1280791 [Mycena vulgaris]|nr:hypothetical protein DFH09DRAFT_1280791 [Mycena vulgaris]
MARQPRKIMCDRDRELKSEAENMSCRGVRDSGRTPMRYRSPNTSLSVNVKPGSSVLPTLYSPSTLTPLLIPSTALKVHSLDGDDWAPQLRLHPRLRGPVIWAPAILHGNLGDEPLRLVLLRARAEAGWVSEQESLKVNCNEAAGNDRCTARQWDKMFGWHCLPICPPHAAPFPQFFVTLGHFGDFGNSLENHYGNHYVLYRSSGGGMYPAYRRNTLQTPIQNEGRQNAPTFCTRRGTLNATSDFCSEWKDASSGTLAESAASMASPKMQYSPSQNDSSVYSSGSRGASASTSKPYAVFERASGWDVVPEGTTYGVRGPETEEDGDLDVDVVGDGNADGTQGLCTGQQLTAARARESAGTGADVGDDLPAEDAEAVEGRHCPDARCACAASGGQGQGQSLRSGRGDVDVEGEVDVDVMSMDAATTAAAGIARPTSISAPTTLPFPTRATAVCGAVAEHGLCTPQPHVAIPRCHRPVSSMVFRGGGRGADVKVLQHNGDVGRMEEERGKEDGAVEEAVDGVPSPADAVADASPSA